MPDSPRPLDASAIRQYGAECLGTFSLVLAVAGAAVFGSAFDDGQGDLNFGFLGVALALGLTVLASAYAWGPISGGHFNPAVTLGMAVAGRTGWRLVAGYIVAQVVGGILGATVIFAVAAGGPAGFLAAARRARFASTGWGELSPGGFALPSAFAVEFVTTAMFVGVILAVTSRGRDPMVAPVAIGLSLTVIALVAIPVSNGSFNPARSLATAIYGGPAALAQVWMSVLAPTLGAVLAGAVARVMSRLSSRPRSRAERPGPSRSTAVPEKARR
jgi:aquaporin Z